tara:strand:+ start:273 stop:605 length:333 start_codon:yes stop_codon:yes gene_type:complete
MDNFVSFLSFRNKEFYLFFEFVWFLVYIYVFTSVILKLSPHASFESKAIEHEDIFSKNDVQMQVPESKNARQNLHVARLFFPVISKSAVEIITFHVSRINLCMGTSFPGF